MSKLDKIGKQTSPAKPIYSSPAKPTQYSPAMPKSVLNKNISPSKINRKNKTLTFAIPKDNAQAIDDHQFQKILHKPDDQLQLSTEELEEDIIKVLKTNNPTLPERTILYSYKEKCFKPQPQIEQFVFLFKLEGNYMHIDSNEAKLQFEKIRTNPAVRARYIKMKSLDKEKFESEKNDNEEFEDNEEDNRKEDDEVETNVIPTKSLNSEYEVNSRPSQANPKPYRNTEMMTEPPPHLNFCENATQDVIYDIYCEDFRLQQLRKKAMERKFILKHDKNNEYKKKIIDIKPNQESIEEMKELYNSALILERIIHQNECEDIINDFKYFEDKADNYRSEGSLLPLWKFSFKKAKSLCVTSICWVPKYSDMFVASYGSYSLLQLDGGFIACFTFKNTIHPYILYESKTGCSAIDIHPEYNNQLIAGFYDGGVALYDISDTKKDSYICSSVEFKHRDPVWQIMWDKNDLYGNMTFFSISSDGKVVRWTIKRNKLYHTLMINLNDRLTLNDDLYGTLITGCGTCFDFNAQNDLLFVVGTEEGKVYKCTKGYSTKTVYSFDAHTMCVYAIRWNKHYPKYFLTCSSDNTVKLWDHSILDPLSVFDLGSPVCDVCWAIYSSTVFAAVTLDGKIFVFDLNIELSSPICEQILFNRRKTRLTRVSFSVNDPILLVGDDRGLITSLKLSPNLRKKPREVIKKDVKISESEVAKLERVIASIREADVKYVPQIKTLDIEKSKEPLQKIVPLNQFTQLDDQSQNLEGGENNNEGNANSENPEDKDKDSDEDD